MTQIGVIERLLDLHNFGLDIHPRRKDSAILRTVSVCCFVNLQSLANFQFTNSQANIEAQPGKLNDAMDTFGYLLY